MSIVADALYMGGALADAAYLGSTLVWQPTAAVTEPPTRVGSMPQALSGGATSGTWSVTVPDGADLLVIAIGSNEGTLADLTSVTYGGTALTLLAHDQAAIDATCRRADLYYMVNPPVGTANAVVTLPLSAAFIATAIMFSGVDVDDPFGTPVIFKSTSTIAPSTTVTATDTDVVLGVLAQRNTTGSTVTGTPAMEQLYLTPASAGNANRAGASLQAGQASVVTSWSWTGSDDATLISVAIHGGSGGGGTVTPPDARPYLNAADWLWEPIPDNPVLDANSAAMVTKLAEAGQQRILNAFDYAVTIRGPEGIDAATPRYDINFTAGWGDPFGTTQMPVPDGTPVPPGGDGHVSVVDPVTAKVFNLWQANFSGATKSASYGAMVDETGDGIETVGSSTGAGLARLAGVIRIEELQAGEIPHALFFSTDWAAPGTNFRYPASKSDGNGTGLAGEIPEGARIQLDPSIDVDALPITDGEKIIAKALQTHGAYCGDNGGARMAFIAELEDGVNNPGATYVGLGIGWDYFGLDGIPWSSLRVLASWDGA